MILGVQFAKHVSISADVCYCGKGRLNFIPDKAKANAIHYVETLLHRLFEDDNLGRHS